jgi:hypothetical protein
MMQAWRKAARPPTVDPSGRYHASIAELAAHAGRDVADMLDAWDERATAYVYDGRDRGEAERLAYEDLVAAVMR